MTAPPHKLSTGHGLRALTLRPPWAWAIIRARKRIENRTWTTHYRGPLAIHSSSKLALADVHRLERILGRRIDPSRLVRGAIMATANLVDIVPTERCRGRWVSGPYCWVLRDVRPLKSPIYVTGALQLWDPRSRCTRSQMAELTKHLSTNHRK